MYSAHIGPWGPMDICRQSWKSLYVHQTFSLTEGGRGRSIEGGFLIASPMHLNLILMMYQIQQIHAHVKMGSVVTPHAE